MVRGATSRLTLVTLLAILPCAHALPAPTPTFRRGDADTSGQVDISDAVLILEVVFGAAPRPGCMDAADANDDGSVDLSDAVRTLDSLFSGGAPLQTPREACLADETADDLPECSYPPCCGATLPQLPGAVLFDAAPRWTLRSGTLITLHGANFPENRNASQVLFTSAGGRVEGFITDVRVASQPPPCKLSPSEMDVVVPTGFSTGMIELVAGGRSAGEVRASGVPQIYAVTIGQSEDQVCVPSLRAIDFVDFSTPVHLHGLNLGALSEIRLQDRQENIQRVPPRELLFYPAPGCPAESIYETASFEFDIRLSFPLPRDDMEIMLRAGEEMSNRFQVPVCGPFESPGPILDTAVVNAVRVPPGVSSGSVVVEYRCYDATSATQTMRLEWSVDGGETWFEALPAMDDPRHDDPTAVACGEVTERDEDCELPGGASAKTFVWDAERDPEFAALGAAREEPPGVPRPWTVRFRIRYRIEDPDGSLEYEHIVETPDIAYVE